MHFKRITILVGVCMLFVATAYCIPTQVIIRVRAKGAKYIGSSLGGAMVIIKNALNDSLIARGLTAGATGDNQKLMNALETENRSSPGDAAFIATVYIDKPLFVTIEVISPFNYRGVQSKVTTQQWILPGRDITGDGIVIEIPGLIVNITSPGIHEYIRLVNNQPSQVLVTANVVMMCGCIISERSPWPKDSTEVTGDIYLNGKFSRRITLDYLREDFFQKALTFTEKGNYEIIVSAYQHRYHNAGAAIINFVVN